MWRDAILLEYEMGSVPESPEDGTCGPRKESNLSAAGQSDSATGERGPVSPLRCRSASSDWCNSTSTVTSSFARVAASFFDSSEFFFFFLVLRLEEAAALGAGPPPSCSIALHGLVTVRVTGRTAPASAANPSPSVFGRRTAGSDDDDDDEAASWGLRV